MIILFECSEDNCPNAGVVYRMDSETVTAMCGGCKEILTGTVEESAE